MSGEHQAFADWLRQRAEQAGYDLDKRGVISQLARDSGNDPAQMSRFLRGQAIPAVEGQAGLARAFGIKLPEVMIQAGSAKPDDFPDYGQQTRPSNYSLDAAADALGVTDQERRYIIQVMPQTVEIVRSAVANAEAQPPRSQAHRQRGVGGHPRPHEVKADEPDE